MLHRPLKTQSALVGKDDNEETMAQNVKPILSRLEGLTSSGYNWKPSFALLVAKKRAKWNLRGSRFTLVGYVFVMLTGVHSVVKGGNSL